MEAQQPLLGSAAEVCCEALERILAKLGSCLDEPEQLIQQCALSTGARLLRSVGYDRRVGTLRKSAAILADKTRARHATAARAPPPLHTPLCIPPHSTFHATPSP